ncbi:5,10-methylenetetrahydrofolate reductase [Streptomyces sp. V4I8]|uniref:hypothetical protein n=1 Tax=Streptomyces sp. V4I8 TaxID=3156469 RepID=UPI00351625A2
MTRGDRIVRRQPRTGSPPAAGSACLEDLADAVGNEDLPMRLEAARAVKRSGFVPVPHLSARRLQSRAELEEFLAALREDGLSEHVFVISGDPNRPHGPYEDALTVIRSGLLQKYGVRHVGVSGYPEGHPAIGTPVLWSALEEKAAALAEAACPAAASPTTRSPTNSS